MTLVAGVDSSTQSCKVVDPRRRDRRAGPPGAGGPPGRHRGAPGRLVGGAAAGDRRGRRARRRRRRLGRRPAARHGRASTRTARWSGRRCCGTTPARAGAAADLIAELGGGDEGRRPGRTRSGWCRSPASPSPSCAGWPSTSRSNAARTAAVCLPHDWLTWRLAGAAGPGRAAHRPQRRQRHRLLVGRDRRVPARPARAGRSAGEPVVPEVLGPTGVAGHAADRRRRSGPGAGDNAAAALGAGALPGDVVVSIGTSGTVFSVADDAGRRPERHRRRVRRRHRPLPAAGRHAQRGPGARRRRHAARRRPRRSCPSWRCPRRPAPTGWCWCPYLEGERTPNRPLATGALHGLTLQTSDPGPPGPGRGRGHAVRARRRPGRAGRAGRGGQPGHPGRRRRALARRSAGSRPRCSAARCWCRRPGEYVADGAARQAAWVALAATSRPAWSGGAVEVYEAGRSPAIREQYAAARDDRQPRSTEPLDQRAVRCTRGLPSMGGVRHPELLDLHRERLPGRVPCARSARRTPAAATSR